MNVNGLPPGLQGWVLADVMRQQQQEQATKQALARIQMQQAQAEQDLLPLKKAKMQAEVDEQKRLQDLMAMFIQQRGLGGQPGQPMPPGIPQQGPGMPQGSQGQGGATGLRLPPDIALGLLHPRIAPLAKEEAKNFTPTDKMRELISRGIQPGSAQWNAELGTHFNQGGAWQVGQSGGVNLAPGYAQGQGDIRRAEEGARAGFDIVTTPGVGNQPPTRDTRANIVEEINRGRAAPVVPQPQMRPPGFPVINPAEQAIRDQEAANINAGRAPNGGPPVSTRSVIAGPSPAQVTEDKTREASALARATSGVKNEDAILDAGRAATQNLVTLNMVAPKLEQLQTGPLYPTMMRLSAYFKQFGVDVGDVGMRLGEAEATRSILNQLALNIRQTGGQGGQGGVGMPGNMSDADREFLVKSVPNLSNVPDGNRLLIDILGRLERRKIEEASIVNRMQSAGESSQAIRSALDQYARDRYITRDMWNRFGFKP